MNKSSLLFCMLFELVKNLKTRSLVSLVWTVRCWLIFEVLPFSQNTNLCHIYHTLSFGVKRGQHHNFGHIITKIQQIILFTSDTTKILDHVFQKNPIQDSCALIPISDEVLILKMLVQFSKLTFLFWKCMIRKFQLDLFSLRTIQCLFI